jgi:hypothetical protein
VIYVRVQKQGERWVCDVALDHAGETTNHTVTVSADDLARWGHGSDVAAVRDLVSRSFAFLLERETPSAILQRFDLSVIPRYFPEYHEHFER